MLFLRPNHSLFADSDETVTSGKKKWNVQNKNELATLVDSSAEYEELKTANKNHNKGQR